MITLTSDLENYITISDIKLNENLDISIRETILFPDIYLEKFYDIITSVAQGDYIGYENGVDAKEVEFIDYMEVSNSSSYCVFECSSSSAKMHHFMDDGDLSKEPRVKTINMAYDDIIEIIKQIDFMKYKNII